jgi:uncharacterized protein
MRFWDSSAIIPLLIDETTSHDVRQLHDADPEMAVWWGTQVECASGFCRLRREGVIDVAEESEMLRSLDDLSHTWNEILPADAIRSNALRLLRVHPLRAGDALQLAAALECRRGSGAEDFVSFDERLADAARLEGFRLPL